MSAKVDANFTMTSVRRRCGLSASLPWTLVIPRVCVCVDNCSDLRNNRISVIEDGAFDGMHQLEEL